MGQLLFAEPVDLEAHRPCRPGSLTSCPQAFTQARARSFSDACIAEVDRPCTPRHSPDRLAHYTQFQGITTCLFIGTDIHQVLDSRHIVPLTPKNVASRYPNGFEFQGIAAQIGKKQGALHTQLAG